MDFIVQIITTGVDIPFEYLRLEVHEGGFLETHVSRQEYWYLLGKSGAMSSKLYVV